MKPMVNSAGKNPAAPVPPKKDLRRHRRFQISVPVEVRVPESEQPPLETVSRNLSAKGVYFTLASSAPIESPLELFMTLPPQMSPGRPVRLHCQGRIVRREMLEGQERIGVAAAIDEYEFIPID